MSHLSLLASSGYLTIPTGVVYFKPTGGAVYEELGIVEPMELKPEFEDKEIYDPRSGVRTLADVNTSKTTLTFTASMKMLTGRVRAIALASTLAYENQASASGSTKTVTNAAAGDVIDLGKLSVTVSSVTDSQSAAVAYVLGTNYEVDAEAGLVKILAIPGGANTSTVITYDNAAILTAAKHPRIGIANNPDLRGSIIIRGTNVVGIKTLVKLPSIRMRPSGARGYSTEDYVSVDVEGRIFSDTTQASGEELGYEQTL